MWKWVDEPVYAGGLYLGFRADTSIVPINVKADNQANLR
jgi:hypothetical protein